MTNKGFYRAKVKLYGFLPVLKVLEYYEGLEKYSECALIKSVIEEINKKRPPNLMSLPSRMTEEIIDFVLQERQKEDPTTTLSDLFELVDTYFEKIIMEVAKENSSAQLN
jgi:hypothetical protein